MLNTMLLNYLFVVLVIQFKHIYSNGDCFTSIIPGTQHGYVLKNYVFITEKGIHLFACLKLCSQYNLCASLNYMDTMECQLNAVTSSSYPDDFVQNKGGLYITKYDFQKVRILLKSNYFKNILWLW